MYIVLSVHLGYKHLKKKNVFFFFALTLLTAIFFTINGIFDTILNENRTKGELSHQEIKIFD